MIKINEKDQQPTCKKTCSNKQISILYFFHINKHPTILLVADCKLWCCISFAFISNLLHFNMHFNVFFFKISICHFTQIFKINHLMCVITIKLLNTDVLTTDGRRDIVAFCIQSAVQLRVEACGFKLLHLCLLYWFHACSVLSERRKIQIDLALLL